MITVYIDVLFLVNFIINILIIEGTSAMMKEFTKPWRTITGAFIGAIYAVGVFFMELNFSGSIIIKILISAMIVFCAFPFTGYRKFLKMIGGFYLVSFIFGGFVVAVLSFTNLGVKMGAIYSNGAVYLSLPWQLLLLTGGATYILICIFSQVRQKKIERMNVSRNLTIYSKGKRIDLKAIIDTGNSLCDPITKIPVIVCEYECIKNILPQGGGTILENMIEAKFKVRIIPFVSVGKENGVMVGFVPDKIEVDDREAKECIVGICENRLSNKEDYHALLNPMLIMKGKAI